MFCACTALSTTQLQITAKPLAPAAVQKKWQLSMGNREGARFAEVFQCVNTQGDIYLWMLVEVLFPTGAKGSQLCCFISASWCYLCLQVHVIAGFTTPLNKTCFLKAALTMGSLSCVSAKCSRIGRSCLSHPTRGSGQQSGRSVPLWAHTDLGRCFSFAQLHFSREAQGGREVSG